MDSDRELLEKAAKAAGMALDYTIRPDGLAFYHSDRNAFALADGGWFAPLTEDADALRLAVKLDLQLAPDPANEMSCAWLANMDDAEIIEGTCAIEMWRDSDKLSAMRRAIVRAAAAMAKESDSE